MSGDYPKSMRKKSSHGLLRSFQKELSYIAAVITKPVTVELLNRKYELKPPTRHVISKTVFDRKFSCTDYPGCDLCCAGCWSLFLWNVTSDKTISKMEKTIAVKINGKDFAYSGSNHADPQSDCQFLVNGCTVHTENAITCMFPLIKFQKRGDTVYIMKSIYSRNWIIQCPAKFSEYRDHNEFKKDTLWKFERFKKYMDTLKIHHNVDIIIKHLKYRWYGELGKWKS